MNAKLEAEILNIREDLFNQISTMKSSKDENDKLILEIHKEKVNIRLDLPLRRFTASTDQGHGDEFYFCAKKVLSPPALAECRRSRGSITS